MTVSCAEGDTGYVYAGRLDFDLRRLDVQTMPALAFKIAMNVGNPDRAFAFRALPNAGVGLARLEFIVGNSIGVHPRALLDFERLPEALRESRERANLRVHESPESFFVEKLVEGVATIAAAFRPKPVIRPPVGLQVRRSTPTSIGGELYEPGEANPMLGFRRGGALPVGRVPPELRARVAAPHAPGVRRDGLHQRRSDGPVRAQRLDEGPARSVELLAPQRPGAGPQRSENP